MPTVIVLDDAGRPLLREPLADFARTARLATGVMAEALGGSAEAARTVSVAMAVAADPAQSWPDRARAIVGVHLLHDALLAIGPDGLAEGEAGGGACCAACAEGKACDGGARPAET